MCIKHCFPLLTMSDLQPPQSSSNSPKIPVIQDISPLKICFVTCWAAIFILDLQLSEIQDHICVKGAHFISKPGDRGISIMYSSVWQLCLAWLMLFILSNDSQQNLHNDSQRYKFTFMEALLAPCIANVTPFQLMHYFNSLRSQ